LSAPFYLPPLSPPPFFYSVEERAGQAVRPPPLLFSPFLLLRRSMFRDHRFRLLSRFLPLIFFLREDVGSPALRIFLPFLTPSPFPSPRPFEQGDISKPFGCARFAPPPLSCSPFPSFFAFFFHGLSNRFLSQIGCALLFSLPFFFSFPSFFPSFLK